MFDMFMIGKAQTTARPYIMFSCKHRKSRKAAAAAIKESNILEQCPPGIGIGDWDYPPHLKNLRQLALSAVDPDVATDIIHTETDIDLYSCSVYSVVDLKSGRVSALRLATRQESAKDGHPSMATIGSVIEIHGKRFYLVPAHIFNTTAPRVTSEDTDILSEDSECDLDDFDSDSENLSGAQDEAEFMSQYSASPDASDREEDWDLDDGVTISDGESIQGFDERNEQPPRIEMTVDEVSASVNAMELYSAGHFAFSVNRPPHLSSHSLDYCLIEVDNDEKISKDVPVLSRDTIGQLNHRYVNVMAVTGSGNVLKGVLSSQSLCMQLPNATKYINVLSVQFEGSLHPGDCGSIIRDVNTGEIYGHLVAGDTDSQVAFIVQAADVLDDVMAKLPSPEAVSAGQKASASPSPQSPFIESIDQGSNGSSFGVPCHGYDDATEERFSPDSPLDGPSLATGDNDPTFSESRGFSRPHSDGTSPTSEYNDPYERRDRHALINYEIRQAVNVLPSQPCPPQSEPFRQQYLAGFRDHLNSQFAGSSLTEYPSAPGANPQGAFLVPQASLPELVPELDSNGGLSQEAGTAVDLNGFRNDLRCELAPNPSPEPVSQLLEYLHNKVNEHLSVFQGEPMLPTEQPAKKGLDKTKRYYRCRERGCGTEVQLKNTFKRHLEDMHYPQVEYYCCHEGCHINRQPFHRRDKILNHHQMIHGVSREGVRKEIDQRKVLKSCPPVCAVCSVTVSDWAWFYECYADHCEIIPAPDSPRQGNHGRGNKRPRPDSDDFDDDGADNGGLGSSKKGPRHPRNAARQSQHSNGRRNGASQHFLQQHSADINDGRTLAAQDHL